MNPSIKTACRRQHRATAARLLLSLHMNSELENPQIWTWETLDRLPSWCLLSAEERQELQRVCGAVYLSPEIRFWIDKPRLWTLQDTLGEMIFCQIMAHADELKLPREPISHILQKRFQSIPSVESVELDGLLLSAGATVLAATVHESLPQEILLNSLGETLGETNADAAQILHKVALQFMAQTHSKQAIES